MAIYHLSMKIFSRGEGAAAVAKAAYRSGELIANEYDGLTHDYTKKKGVVHKEILLPENAPAAYSNRAVLWNAVEKIEKAINSQLARELEISLPIEFSREQNISLIREYVKRNFVDKGMCADLCVHDTNDGNPHAHIMLTTRPLNENGTWGVKQRKEYILDEADNKIYNKSKRQYKCKSIPTTDWNEHTKAEEWRMAWADAVNTIFEKQGSETRIDHRSYERQGIDLIPTVHMGAAATQMERDGKPTELGNKNREIAELNKKLRQIKARISKLENSLKENQTDTPPTLWEVFSEMTTYSAGLTEKQKVAQLKLAAQTDIFIDKYNVKTLADMTAVVGNLRKQHNEMHSTLVPMSRRYHTLVEHIRQADNYTKHIKINNEYNKLKGDEQDAYFKKHSTEISEFTEAHNYLTKHLNGHTKIPYQDWKSELDDLTVDRDSMLLKSEQLTAELKNAETLMRNAEKVMSEVASSGKFLKEKNAEL